MKHIKLFENFSKRNPYIYDDPKIIKDIEERITKDGSSFICTYVASLVKKLEGDNVKIYGFSTYKNPEADYFVELEGEDSDDGHHFAVLDDRYIIDPWIYNNYKNYPQTFNRSVFDLQSKDDEEIIKYVYGDKNNWVDITKEIVEKY